MKKYIIILLLFPVLASAQKSEIVSAISGENLNEAVSASMQYVFPEFSAANVIFKNSPKAATMMNYNMLLGEMHFMKNDEVLALSDLNNVSVVVINNRRFYPFNSTEFTEEIQSTDDVKLRVRRKGNVAQHSKEGAYGMQQSASSITSYSSIENSDGGGRTNLNVKANVLISIRKFYYLVGHNGKYVQIRNQKSFMNQFPGNKSKIELFVKEHKTNFNKEDDLIELFEYCITL
jgi:hypothetical protein